MNAKLVYGVGITDIETKANGVSYKAYKLWVGILSRCYSKNRLKIHPSYVGCVVCDDWLTYSTFKKDVESMIGYDFDGWQIDKDIINKGNKVYSKENCAFVPEYINKMLPSCRKKRGKYPVGVAKMKGREGKAFESKCNNGKGVRIHLGCYSDELSAFGAYKAFKENLIKLKAEELKGIVDDRIYNALKNYQVEITD